MTKPNLKYVPPVEEERDVRVNYSILKKVDGEPSDIAAALEYLTSYVQNNSIYFYVEPTIFENELLFSLIGFPRDQRAFHKSAAGEMGKYNCTIRCSALLPLTE